MDFNEFESNEKIICIDSFITFIKDDALLIDIMDNGNYFINLFITNPCVNIDTDFITKEYIETSEYEIIKKSKRDILKKYSLSSSKENDVISYKMEVDKDGNLINFSFGKDKISIDVELTDIEVSDIIEDDTSVLSDYLVELYRICDILYQKRTGQEIDKRYCLNDENYFGLYVINEIISLVNIKMANYFYENNLPCIYDVKEVDKNYNAYYYYTSEPCINEKYNSLYGAFTSPLQTASDLKNIQILNDAFFREYETTEEKEKVISRHRGKINDYVSFKKRTMLGKGTKI